ncbi:LacI family DNA-binding transcriptional regulator [Arthrobacter sp. AZCC_0090]|uniref:LacI family DNA-binding transcriptional regulator n=1 Tax=Arthrobacter sp. AZCC_0090 TaxID=2735881 RepID=UPI002892FA8D|nr:LacI family DNA-binding transcriptional regulator [Arthrobacter sp. AZCC_0090]
MGIRDVAKAAQVSVTTVSHALNDRRGSRISAATKEHVRAVAEDLGYAPNRLASGLRNNRSYLIGLVSDEIATTPFAGDMILGAQDAAYERGCLLMMLDAGGDGELEKRQVSTLLQHQVDGIVYARMYHQRIGLPVELAGVPTVLLDAVSADEKVSSVIPDEVEAARLAVRSLVAAGHRHIGFINNLDDIPATHGRLLGYQEALKESGIEFDPALVVAGVPETNGGRAAAMDVLSGPSRPTALFCFNDQMAMGAYQAAGSLGLEIPRDLSVIGIDNLELIAAALWPGLTTMALPHYDMGRWAVKQLLNEIEKPDDVEPVQMMFDCPLVQRGSVAPPLQI